MSKSRSYTPSNFTRALRFLSDYFLNSPDKWKARALFIGSLLCVVTLVGLGFILGWWCFPLLFAAFIAKDAVLLLVGLGAGLLLAGTMASVNYLANFLKNTLYVNWRSWLTKKIINEYLNNKTNFLSISRIYNELDNPEQRIQDDIDKVTKSFLDLSFGFIENFSNLVIYTVLLSLAGGSLVLFSGAVVIPGFLVLVALGVGVTSSLISYFINKSLRKSTNEETVAQSNLRADLQQIKTSAEEISIERGTSYYKARLEKEVDEIEVKSTKRLSIQNGTDTFNFFNGVLQVIIPFLAAAPLYFADLISLDVFNVAGYYFSMMTRSLSWFADSFEKVNKFQTSLQRIVELQQVLESNDSESTQKIIRHIVPENRPLEVINLNLNLHKDDTLIIRGLNLQFTPKMHTLIQAPSGTGKSSLFKAIAGTWLSGEGEILIPGDPDSVYFLPQRPTIPNDTLRMALAYPDAECFYSDEELSSALHAVNMGALEDQLYKPVGSNKSLGEQQRIAFARIILRKPKWVFLDEATASLDEEVEKQVYNCLKGRLPETTFISIAHRSTVRQHHNNILMFKVDDTKEVEVEEYRLMRRNSF